ncbi:hypothetical protein MBLNU230_g4888t1 [Neophaeotheca triangularis]
MSASNTGKLKHLTCWFWFHSELYTCIYSAEECRYSHEYTGRVALPPNEHEGQMIDYANQALITRVQHEQAKNPSTLRPDLQVLKQELTDMFRDVKELRKTIRERGKQSNGTGQPAASFSELQSRAGEGSLEEQSSSFSPANMRMGSWRRQDSLPQQQTSTSASILMSAAGQSQMPASQNLRNLALYGTSRTSGDLGGLQALERRVATLVCFVSEQQEQQEQQVEDTITEQHDSSESQNGVDFLATINASVQGLQLDETFASRVPGTRARNSSNLQQPETQSPRLSSNSAQFPPSPQPALGNPTYASTTSSFSRANRTTSPSPGSASRTHEQHINSTRKNRTSKGPTGAGSLQQGNYWATPQRSANFLQRNWRDLGRGSQTIAGDGEASDNEEDVMEENKKKDTRNKE